MTVLPFRIAACLLAIVLIPQFPLAADAAQPPAKPPRSLEVYPAQIAFSGPRDEQRLIVLGVWAD
ncbi:MAG: hypothetical protein LC104_01960, partial [Bacteroidales bacterium]|nr:hypothetical protein [Bacteroidales bacterium]